MSTVNPLGEGPASRRKVDPTIGARLLDREPPEGYRAEWTAHLAKPPKRSDVTTDSAMIFRVGNEWLALPATWVVEVAPLRLVHSLPHRQGRALAGIVNVRGELVPCFSLERVIGSDAATTESKTRRLFVAGQGARRLVFIVDEVHGVLRYDSAKLLAAPGRLKHVKSLLTWGERTVGVLDAEVLWTSLERSLA